jgi:hypothetical protein
VTTTDNKVTSWRDLIEHLTPDTGKRFERHEHLSSIHGPLAFPDEDPEEVRSRDQQRMLEEAREQIPFAHIALPAAAKGADTWQDNGQGNWSRLVFGPEHKTELFSTWITGVQSPDGTVRWSLSFDAGDEADVPDQIRERAAMLIEAADELERLQ